MDDKDLEEFKKTVEEALREKAREGIKFELERLQRFKKRVLKDKIDNAKEGEQDDI